MKLYINNVGVIQNSVIELSGITVITGNNNSGKSTVGKVLSSIISSTINLKEKALREKVLYANNIIDKVSSLLFENFIFRNKKNKDFLFKNYPFFYKLIEFRYLNSSSFSNIDELKDYIIGIKREIEKIDYEFLFDNFSIKSSNKNFIESFNNNRIVCINMLNNLIETIYNDLDLTKFASKKILDDLNNNFKEQIAPVKYPKEAIEVSLKSNDDVYYNIRISNGKINDNCFSKNPFEYCFLINDVNILDELSDFRTINRYRYMQRYSFAESFSDSIYFRENLNESLLNALIEKHSSFESQTYIQKYYKYLETFDEVFNEDIVFIDGKYVCKDNSLDVRNLATGSKLFAIIKILLEHGKIDTNTLIVLDEPENHLHPAWQLKLARLIVKLTKELNVKFVITTHSPSFLLAIETYSKLDGIKELTNYYYSEIGSNKYNVNFIDVRLDMEKIHYAINKPFIDISNLFENVSEE